MTLAGVTIRTSATVAPGKKTPRVKLLRKSGKPMRNDEARRRRRLRKDPVSNWRDTAARIYAEPPKPPRRKPPPKPPRVKPPRTPKRYWRARVRGEVTFSFSMRPAMVADVDVAASGCQMSRSDFTRQAISYYLAKLGEQPKKGRGAARGFSITMTRELITAVDVAACELGISRSELTREALLYFIDKLNDKSKPWSVR